MHNSAGNAAMVQNGLPPESGNPYLLLNDTPSDICLSCHQGATTSSYDVSTTGTSFPTGVLPVQMTPGGDFAWLKKNYSWLVGSTSYTESGDRHGHNIVAPAYGYYADATNTSAPGGTFPSSALQCTSCHDPHGHYRVLADGSVNTSGAPIIGSGSESVSGVPTNPSSGEAVGTYRLLAGVGYQPPGSGITFTEGPPAAMAPQNYNRSEDVTQTRVAYGAGTSKWCTNCHGQMHSSGSFVHPFDQSLGVVIPNDNGSTTFVDQYNAYVKTGDLSGTAAKSFLSLVPFETNYTNTASDRNALAAMARSDDSNLAGPSSQDTVGCLTCHRAHASGWPYMLRWNNDAPLMVYNGVYPGVDNGAPSEDAMGRTEAETARGYYDRPVSDFALNQDSLCEKCHPAGVSY